MVGVILDIFCNLSFFMAVQLLKQLLPRDFPLQDTSVAGLRTCQQDSQRSRKLVPVMVPQYSIQECSQTRIYQLGESKRCLTEPNHIRQQHFVLYNLGHTKCLHPRRGSGHGHTRLGEQLGWAERHCYISRESNVTLTYVEFSVTMRSSGQDIGVKTFVVLSELENVFISLTELFCAVWINNPAGFLFKGCLCQVLSSICT